MNVSDQLILTLRSLGGHPLRTGLTLLGIVIGVASVVCMTSIGLGARAAVELEIGRLGTHLLVVQSVGRAVEGLRGDDGLGRHLTENDGRALAREVANVEAVVPVVTAPVRLVSRNGNWLTQIVGTSPDYVHARDWGVEAGRNLSEREMRASARVALLGRTVAEQLSPGVSPVGSTVRIGEVPFRVIGVLARKGYSPGGRDEDNVVIAPLPVVKRQVVGGYFRQHREATGLLLLKGSDAEAMPAVQRQSEHVLRLRRGIAAGAQDDFRVRNPSAALSASRSASETMTWWLASIAAVSLLVGGISIMNIMLVSVTERTHEIGVRLALGATRTDLRRQFLLEAAGVAFIGGVAGVAIGVVGAWIVGASLGWMILVSAWVCVGTLIFSTLVGLLSGLYPALRGSRMDPMDAMRYA